MYRGFKGRRFKSYFTFYSTFLEIIRLKLFSYKGTMDVVLILIFRSLKQNLKRDLDQFKCSWLVRWVQLIDSFWVFRLDAVYFFQARPLFLRAIPSIESWSQGCLVRAKNATTVLQRAWIMGRILSQVLLGWKQAVKNGDKLGEIFAKVFLPKLSLIVILERWLPLSIPLLTPITSGWLAIILLLRLFLRWHFPYCVLLVCYQSLSANRL